MLGLLRTAVSLMVSYDFAIAPSRGASFWQVLENGAIPWTRFPPYS
jgi:hypothetical protein